MSYSKKEKENAIMQIDNAIAKTDLKVGYVFLDEDEDFAKEMIKYGKKKIK
jgi:hypothetical protein